LKQRITKEKREFVHMFEFLQPTEVNLIR